MAADDRPSICPACGSGFGCGAGTGSGCGAGTGSCWCVEVEISKARLGELAERYEDCLCPGCLSRLASAAGERAAAPSNAR